MMADAMLYEDYLRRQIERGDFGVAIIPALIAEDMANWMENQREKIEVVRCRDCYWHSQCRFEQELGLEGFCSKGERREDE